MRQNTARQLIRINRRFYQRFSESFAQTRNRPWPGWTRVVEIVRSQPNLFAGDAQLLDLGCGNGRAWPFLSRHLPGEIQIVGLDSSLELLVRARHLSSTCNLRAATALADLYAPEGFPVQSDQFDLVVAFGMLHHIPSSEARVRIIQTALGSLRMGGILAVTFWRRSVLARKRLLEWKAYGRQVPEPLDLDDLETGDVLLTWGSGGDSLDASAVRYCHLFDDDEVRAVATAVGGAATVGEYVSDGPGGSDNWYLILRRTG